MNHSTDCAASFPSRVGAILALVWGCVVCGVVLGQQANSAQRDPAAAHASPPAKKNGLHAPKPAKLDEITINIALRQEQSEISRMLREGRFANPAAQVQFDTFYRDYFLARWSAIKDVAKLLDYRKELRNNFRLTKSGQVYDHLNTLVLDVMNGFGMGNYHPAVRVNAMLTIGDLNSAEPQTLSESAVPLSEALPILIAAAENAQLPDAVRAAAMVGVVRHASSKIRDEAARRSLAAAMLQLASADVPSGTAAAGREWIAAQAMEVLGLLGLPGENNAAIKAMLKAVSNPKLSYSTRTIAVESIGRLAQAKTATLDPTEGSAIVQFARDACAEELRLAKETGYPVSRRRLKQRLDAAAAALPSQAAFAELQKAVKTASDQLDARGSEDKDMTPVVQALRQKLDAWLQKKPQ